MNIITMKLTATAIKSPPLYAWVSASDNWGGVAVPDMLFAEILLNLWFGIQHLNESIGGK